MTHNSSSTNQTEDIEVTAAYGTAVVMTGKREPAMRSHQQRTAAEASGPVASHPNFATGTDRHLGGPRFLQNDDKALNPVEPPARQSIHLAATNDAAKGGRKRPQLRMNLRRKTA